jgi:hypothetical protein
MLSGLFGGRIFTSKKFLLYANLNSAAYFSIALKLQTAGISFRTVTKYQTTEPLSTLRDIYIKKEDRVMLKG